MKNWVIEEKEEMIKYEFATIVTIQVSFSSRIIHNLLKDDEIVSIQDGLDNKTHINIVSPNPNISLNKIIEEYDKAIKEIISITNAFVNKNINLFNELLSYKEEALTNAFENKIDDIFNELYANGFGSRFCIFYLYTDYDGNVYLMADDKKKHVIAKLCNKKKIFVPKENIFINNDNINESL